MTCAAVGTWVAVTIVTWVAVALCLVVLPCVLLWWEARR